MSGQSLRALFRDHCRKNAPSTYSYIIEWEALPEWLHKTWDDLSKEVCLKSEAPVPQYGWDAPTKSTPVADIKAAFDRLHGPVIMALKDEIDVKMDLDSKALANKIVEELRPAMDRVEAMRSVVQKVVDDEVAKAKDKGIIPNDAEGPKVSFPDSHKKTESEDSDYIDISEIPTKECLERAQGYADALFPYDPDSTSNTKDALDFIIEILCRMHGLSPRRKCEACDGSGMIMSHARGNMTCPECNGSGVVNITERT
jgi:hypothetical protein